MVFKNHELMAGSRVGTIEAQAAQFADELAALIAFLAGEPAGYITGSSIAVDGGANKAIV